MRALFLGFVVCLGLTISASSTADVQCFIRKKHGRFYIAFRNDSKAPVAVSTDRWAYHLTAFDKLGKQVGDEDAFRSLTQLILPGPEDWVVLNGKCEFELPADIFGEHTSVKNLNQIVRMEIREHSKRSVPDWISRLPHVKRSELKFSNWTNPLNAGVEMAFSSGRQGTIEVTEVGSGAAVRILDSAEPAKPIWFGTLEEAGLLPNLPRVSPNQIERIALTAFATEMASVGPCTSWSFTYYPNEFRILATAIIGNLRLPVIAKVSKEGKLSQISARCKVSLR